MTSTETDSATSRPRASVQARSGAVRRRATRATIVAAAEQLLIEGLDFDTMSMAEIGRAASVSRATLYLHFKDKRDIIAELAERIVAQRFEIGADLVSDPTMSRQQMRVIVADMARRWAEDAPLLHAIVRLAEQDPAMREVWVHAIDEVGDMGAALMRTRWELEGRPVGDVETLGRVLSWMFERCARQMIEDPESEVRVVDAVTEVVWRVIDYRERP